VVNIFSEVFMEKLIEKAKTLIEALPYIQTFRGKTFVIKVSRRGHITGVWEGAPVDRWLGEADAQQVLAQSDVAQAR